LSKAKEVITNMIQQNIGLVPNFLRMGFHDCIGGCDGTLETRCDSSQHQKVVTIKVHC
jgi:hypothetical protein